MFAEILKPKKKPLIVKGAVSYSEAVRARNIIRLKKEVVNEFLDLKDREKSITYKLEYHRNFTKLKKRIEEINKNGDGIPFLLFIYAEREKGEV